MLLTTLLIIKLGCSVDIIAYNSAGISCNSSGIVYNSAEIAYNSTGI